MAICNTAQIKLSPALNLVRRRLIIYTKLLCFPMHIMLPEPNLKMPEDKIFILKGL